MEDATLAQLSAPTGLARDPSGNLYIADSLNQRIRKVAPDGIITTVAGNGTPGFSGDNQEATNGKLNNPSGVAIGADGNLYIADTYNYRIRRVVGEMIETFAGTGTAGYSGDGGLATSAQFRYPRHITFDASGSLYVSDSLNYCVRRISPSGTISTVAGNGTEGFSGDNSPAIAAQLSDVSGIAVDSLGNVYVADTRNHRIRMFNPGGSISTVAGTGTAGFNGDGRDALATNLSYPAGVVVDSTGRIYVADSWNNRIRMFKPNGTISTVAGTGTFGFSGDGGPASTGQVYFPTGMALDSEGSLYFADTSNHRIRKIGSDGVISTVAGNGAMGFSGDGGPATSAKLTFPEGVAVDSNGDLYIADTQNYRIRKVTPEGRISTVAGNGGRGFNGDAIPATEAMLLDPTDVAIDAERNLSIADALNYRIRKVTPDGRISTVAGTGEQGFSGDGQLASQAKLHYPSGLTVDAKGDLYIADMYNHRVRRVAAATGIIRDGRAWRAWESLDTHCRPGRGESGTNPDTHYVCHLSKIPKI